MDGPNDLPLKTTSRQKKTSRVSPATAVNCARALRDFGDGFIAVLLPVYLLQMGLGELEVGIVSTLTLLGSTAMTLGIGFVGRRWDQRLLLIAAAGLAIAGGWFGMSTFRRESS